MLVLLVGCGKDDTNSNNLVDNTNQGQKPQIAIPAEATASDFSCEYVAEYVRSSGALVTESEPEAGVSYDWQEGNYSVSYSEDSAGGYIALSKTIRQAISESQYSLTVERTEWFKNGAQWDKVETHIERVNVKEGNTRRTISNRVNGVETPYYWISEGSYVSDKVYKAVDRHSKPEVKNTGDKSFRKIEQTCTYTDR